MNEVDDNEQIDADILQCKEDVLRASDVVPPYKNDTPKTPAEAIKPDDAKPLKTKEIEQASAEIPRFDLAEEIMAEHRKITAIKRKGPDKKTEPAAEPISYAIEPQRLALSGQEQIIAEIVTRDIEKLCRG